MPHGRSILWPHLYEILRKKGYSKSKAAAISNSKYNGVKSGALQRHTSKYPKVGIGGQSRSKASAAALKKGIADDRKHYGRAA